MSYRLHDVALPNVLFSSSPSIVQVAMPSELLPILHLVFYYEHRKNLLKDPKTMLWTLLRLPLLPYYGLCYVIHLSFR